MVQFKLTVSGGCRPLVYSQSYLCPRSVARTAKVAGAGVGIRLRPRLTTHEQRAIVYRMVTRSSTVAAARRAGRPDPIWVEAIVKPLDGGGYELVSTRPLRSEYGGDGRTIDNTRGEEPRTTQIDYAPPPSGSQRSSKSVASRSSTRNSNTPLIQTLLRHCGRLSPKPKRKAS